MGYKFDGREFTVGEMIQYCRAIERNQRGAVLDAKAEIIAAHIKEPEWIFPDICRLPLSQLDEVWQAWVQTAKAAEVEARRVRKDKAAIAEAERIALGST